jgi:hypothetical protein
MARLLRPGDGDYVSVRPLAGRSAFTLKELRAHVGGIFELIPVTYLGSNHVLLVLSRDAWDAQMTGAARSARCNAIASTLSRRAILGRAVLLTAAEWEDVAAI